MRRLEVIAVFIVVLVVVGTPVAVFGYESLLRAKNPNEYTIVGRDGHWSPSTVHVKQGARVKLRLTSDDVAHGLAIPDLGIDVHEIYPGKWVNVEFVADTAGRFPFFCSVLCDPKHGSMQGEIVVEGASRPDGAQTTEAPVPTDAGRQIYVSKCAACHGPAGEGGLGPSVIGVSAENLTKKVRTPAGSMPAFAANLLSDDDLKKLADYIGGLGGKR